MASGGDDARFKKVTKGGRRATSCDKTPIPPVPPPSKNPASFDLLTSDDEDDVNFLVDNPYLMEAQEEDPPPAQPSVPP